VEDFNNNADIIDQKLKEIEDKTNNAPADSVNDDAIGTRTPDQSKAPSSPGTGKLTDVLSWLANRIKAIMGSTNWWDTPPVTLQTTKNHIDAKDNPHSVTKSQVGLGNVQNYGIATQSEVEAGTSNSKYMTPLRTMQAIAALSPVKSVNDKTGQVTITPADIGAETPAGAQAKAEAAAGAVQAQLNAHQAEKATETKLGHVKAKTQPDGTLIIPVNVEDGNKYTIVLNDDELLRKVAGSDSYDGAIRCLAVDDDYIYVGGETTRKVYKLNKSNLTKVAESISYGGHIYSLAVDDTYIYVGGYATQIADRKVYKLSKSNLTKVAESETYGGTIRCLALDDDYIYVGGYTTQKVYKLSKSNLTKVVESETYGSTIRCLALDDTYIYVGGETTRKVYKIFNKATVSVFGLYRRE